METVIRHKQYSAHDLWTLGYDLLFKGGLKDYKVIEMSSDTYDAFTSYLKDIDRECKQHNVQITINNRLSDHIRVTYETKVFNW